MSRILARYALVVLAAGTVSAVSARPSSLHGLAIKVAKTDRPSTASPRDCPPGTNTVSAVSKPGEQFALVTVSFTVSSAYKSTPMKRPTVTDSNDKSYFTPSQFVDVASMPEFSCTFPFRVPEGTKLKTLKIENASFDLAAIDK